MSGLLLTILSSADKKMHPRVSHRDASREHYSGIGKRIGCHALVERQVMKFIPKVAGIYDPLIGELGRGRFTVM